MSVDIEIPPRRSLFGPGAERSLTATSPLLTFATVHGTAARLCLATYVEERGTARRRIPVFTSTRGATAWTSRRADPV